MKPFADDTSIFTIVDDPNEAAPAMNVDLNLIKLLAHNLGMTSNSDPTRRQ